MSSDDSESAGEEAMGVRGESIGACSGERESSVACVARAAAGVRVCAKGGRSEGELCSDCERDEEGNGVGSGAEARGREGKLGASVRRRDPAGRAKGLGVDGCEWEPGSSGADLGVERVERLLPGSAMLVASECVRNARQESVGSQRRGSKLYRGQSRGSEPEISAIFRATLIS